MQKFDILLDVFEFADKRLEKMPLLKDMDELREYADEAEALIPDEYLPYPTYGQMLFSLR